MNMRQECEFPPRTCCGPSGSSGPGGAGTPLWSAEHGGLHGQARSKSWSRGCTDCSEPSRPSVLSWPACTSSCTACRHRGACSGPAIRLASCGIPMRFSRACSASRSRSLCGCAGPCIAVAALAPATPSGRGACSSRGPPQCPPSPRAGGGGGGEPAAAPPRVPAGALQAVQPAGGRDAAPEGRPRQAGPAAPLRGVGHPGHGPCQAVCCGLRHAWRSCSQRRLEHVESEVFTQATSGCPCLHSPPWNTMHGATVTGSSDHDCSASASPGGRVSGTSHLLGQACQMWSRPSVTCDPGAGEASLPVRPAAALSPPALFASGTSCRNGVAAGVAAAEPQPPRCPVEGGRARPA
uniref:Uncharacterized protein n=1 Tax=Auxenochlorella protothecoides TaxID=3075 RepID=A0A1D2A9W3_AUXPR